MHVYNKDSPENSKVVVVNGRNMAVAFYRKNFWTFYLLHIIIFLNN